MRLPTAVASVFIAFATVFAQAPVARSEFEAASIKRNLSGDRPWLAPPVGGRFTATNIPLKLLIGIGWPGKLLGGPSWVTTDGYDVTAKEPEPNGISDDDFSLMMQNLLKDRFRLSVHNETRETTVYVLTPARNGLKLPDAKPELCVTGSNAAGPKVECGEMNVTRESISNQKISMEWFASILAGLLGRPVVDKTGFAGSFRVRLEFAPIAPDAALDSPKPSIFSALEEQLGLNIGTEKGTEEVLIIDHVERPSAN